MDGEDDGLDELRNQIKELKAKYEAQQKLLRELRESIDRQQQEVEHLRRELEAKRQARLVLEKENKQLQLVREGMIKQQLDEIESIDIVVLPKNIVVIKFNYKKKR